MKIRCPLNLIPYDKNEAIKILEKNYGWRYYGGKHYESRWTRFFQGYYLPYKFGYDKRKAHLSSLILSKQISRKSALFELKKPLYDKTSLNQDLEFISKKLNLSVPELKKLIDNKPTHYSQFPNHERKKVMINYFVQILKNMLAIPNEIKSLIKKIILKILSKKIF